MKLEIQSKKKGGGCMQKGKTMVQLLGVRKVRAFVLKDSSFRDALSLG